MAARRFGARARVKTLAKEFDTPGEARWSVEAFGDDADTAYVHGRVVTGKRKRKRRGKIAVRWLWPGEPASVLYSAPHLFAADKEEEDKRGQSLCPRCRPGVKSHRRCLRLPSDVLSGPLVTSPGAFWCIPVHPRASWRIS